MERATMYSEASSSPRRALYFVPSKLRSVYAVPTPPTTDVADYAASSALLTPLPKKKFAYYSPSHPRFDETAIPKAVKEETDEVPVITVRKTRVKPLDMKKATSVQTKITQNEQYKTEVQTKLRLQVRKQEMERQSKFKSNYTSYSTSFARSSNTSSMSYNRNKPRNTVRVIRRLREERKVENRNLAQGMRKEINRKLHQSKSQLKDLKLKIAETQRKDDMEHEHIVSESRIKTQEDVTNTVQGQKMVQDVLSSLVQSDMMFAKRFQNLNNMLYSQIRQQRQKLQNKQNVRYNKERVEIQTTKKKNAHEKARAVVKARMAKIKKETEMQQEMINATLTNRKELNRRRDLAIKARMNRDLDLHQSLNPEAFVQRLPTAEGGKEKTIPWAGATSRRMDVFLDQTNKKILQMTQVVSAIEAVEDEDDLMEAEMSNS